MCRVTGCCRSWVIGSGRSGFGFQRAWAGLTWRIGMDEYTLKPMTCGWRCPLLLYFSLSVRSLKGQCIFHSVLLSIFVPHQCLCLLIQTFVSSIFRHFICPFVQYNSQLCRSVAAYFSLLISHLLLWPVIRLIYFRMQFMCLLFLSKTFTHPHAVL